MPTTSHLGKSSPTVATFERTESPCATRRNGAEMQHPDVTGRRSKCFVECLVGKRNGLRSRRASCIGRSARVSRLRWRRTNGSGDRPIATRLCYGPEHPHRQKHWPRHARLHPSASNRQERCRTSGPSGHEHGGQPGPQVVRHRSGWHGDHPHQEHRQAVRWVLAQILTNPLQGFVTDSSSALSDAPDGPGAFVGHELVE